VRLSCCAAVDKADPKQTRKKRCFKVMQVLVYFKDVQDTAIT
jgi:hypothetical protein